MDHLDSDSDLKYNLTTYLLLSRITSLVPKDLSLMVIIRGDGKALHKAVCGNCTNRVRAGSRRNVEDTSHGGTRGDTRGVGRRFRDGSPKTERPLALNDPLALEAQGWMSKNDKTVTSA